MPDIRWPEVSTWLLTHGVRILVILVAAYIISRVAARLLPRVTHLAIARVEGRRDEDEVRKRARTLSIVGVRTLQVVLVLVAGFMVLAELGMNIAPALAGVGILGLAVSFGAQNLVRDLINGVFILIENQYSKGDVVNLAGVGGLVEELNLRRTVLRDLDGAVHSIPNGEIRVASNLTRDWSRVNMNITVSFEDDLERVTALIDKVGRELAEDPIFGPMLVTPPRALRVDKFADSGMEIKILGETKPGKQWDVMGELRWRLKKAFEAEGIEVPFSERTTTGAARAGQQPAR
ncbi:MAG: mechanosensitive ion channel family protein [Chloroflexi bacterium]|nr:mechanosensitive ion channel family protein [Chloroflexota bacterium]